MTMKRVWLVVGVLGVAGVLVLGWFLLVQPMVNGAFRAEDEAFQIEASNAELEAQIAVLAKDYKGITDLRGELEEVLASVPGELELADLISQLDSAQATSGIRIVSISPGEAVPYVPAMSQVATPQPTGADGTATDAAAPALPAQVGGSAGVAPANPADTQRLSTAGLVLVPIDIQVVGDPAQVLAFAKALQDMSRLFLVTTVEAIDGDAPSGSITGYIYVLPQAFVSIPPE